MDTVRGQAPERSPTQRNSGDGWSRDRRLWTSNDVGLMPLRRTTITLGPQRQDDSLKRARTGKEQKTVVVSSRIE